MPVSEMYVVELLLQQTRSGAVCWRRPQDGPITTRMNGVDVALQLVPASSGSRVELELSDGERVSSVFEPFSIGFFSRRYDTDEQERLADALRALWNEALKQCCHREEQRDRDYEKQALFAKLLFAARLTGRQERPISPPA